MSTTCITRSLHPSSLAAFALTLLTLAFCNLFLNFRLWTLKGSVGGLAAVEATLAALLVIPVAVPGVVAGKPLVR